ncbi:MAG: hypothetical protein IPK19_35920 [Chloroflexi bacterium]|nr:hypothetical protein [Chloroflexota bacterium]
MAAATCPTARRRSASNGGRGADDTPPPPPGAGLPLAVAAGIPIWVPHTEQDLFCRVDAHRQAREIACNHYMRQDRFSRLEP